MNNTLFPARNCAPLHPGRETGVFPDAELCSPAPRAGNGAFFRRGTVFLGIPGGKRGLFPTQAATFSLPGRKMIPFPDAEQHFLAPRAGNGAFSRAGGYIFSSRAENDTFSRRRTAFLGTPGGKQGYFPAQVAPPLNNYPLSLIFEICAEELSKMPQDVQQSAQLRTSSTTNNQILIVLQIILGYISSSPVTLQNKSIFFQIRSF